MTGGYTAIELLDPTPEYLRNRRLPWESIKIMALGDIQFGSEGCDIPKLKDYIAEGLSQDCWFGFMGDAVDAISPSGRRKLANSGLYDTTMGWIEEKAQEDVEKMAEILAPTKDRWAWWLEGHHLFEFSDGTTTDTQLCQRLGAPFVGTCGFMRLRFVEEKDGRNVHSQTCDIWAHHGTGGGSTVGAILNRLERVAGSFSADLYFMGHANRLGAAPKPLLELGGSGANLYLKNRDRYLVATGAFDRGYQVGSKAGRTQRPRGGYVEQGAMLPTGLGCPIVEVTPVMQGNVASLKIRVTV